MRREHKAPMADRTEREIGSWLRDRDAGPAPDRLRMRIARVVAVGERGRRPGLWAVLRPAAALGAVAAVAVIVLASVALRGAGPVGGPGASLMPTSPPTPLPPGMTPWPRTGAVLALPVNGPLGGLLVLASYVAALLLLGWMIRGSFSGARRLAGPDMSWRALRQLRSPRAWLLRVIGVLLCAALIVAGYRTSGGFGGSAPLQYGSWFGYGSHGAALGARSGVGGGADETYERFVPGGQIDLGIALTNQGDKPLTVTSFDTERFLAEQPAGAFIDSVELRLPPGLSNAAGCDAYAANATVSTGICTQAFHPFELPAGGEVSLRFIVHLKNCTLAAAGPTPAPNALSGPDYLPTTGYAVFIDLPFRYSLDGMERETDVGMRQAVGLVFGSSSVTC